MVGKRACGIAPKNREISFKNRLRRQSSCSIRRASYAENQPPHYFSCCYLAERHRRARSGFGVVEIIAICFQRCAGKDALSRPAYEISTKENRLPYRKSRPRHRSEVDARRDDRAGTCACAFT